MTEGIKSNKCDKFIKEMMMEHLKGLLNEGARGRQNDAEKKGKASNEGHREKSKERQGGEEGYGRRRG
jgi:hypothetical protein